LSRNSLGLDDLTGDLGFEPSYEALRRYWSDVAIALPGLQMRRSCTANTLNQDWARTGNMFPYFSPVLPARACLASPGFESGASAIAMRRLSSVLKPHTLSLRSRTSVCSIAVIPEPSQCVVTLPERHHPWPFDKGRPQRSPLFDLRKSHLACRREGGFLGCLWMADDGRNVRRVDVWVARTAGLWVSRPRGGCLGCLVSPEPRLLRSAKGWMSGLPCVPRTQATSVRQVEVLLRVVIHRLLLCKCSSKHALLRLAQSWKRTAQMLGQSSMSESDVRS
jgi:hypothetical protein